MKKKRKKLKKNISELDEILGKVELIPITEEEFDNEISNGATKFTNRKFVFPIDITLLPSQTFEFVSCNFNLNYEDDVYSEDDACLDISSGNSIKAKLNFEHCKFSNTLFYLMENPNQNFENEISFEDCIFKKSVFVKDARFLGLVSFLSCNFKSRTTFLNTVFETGVNFSNSIFKKECSFYDTFFYIQSDFYNVKFNKLVKFSKSNFTGQVDFRKVKFKKVSDFFMCDFDAEILFEYAKFKGKKSSVFFNVTFNSNTVFDYVEFGQSVKFEFTKFYSTTSFKKTIFHENLEIIDSIFENQNADGNYFDFYKTIFKGKADFTRTKFARGIYFNKVEFAASANFNYCILNSQIEFTQCCFAKQANLYAINNRDTNILSKNKSEKDINDILNVRKGRILFLQSVFEGLLNMNDSYFGSLEFRGNSFKDYVMLPPYENIKTPTRSFYRLAKHQKAQERDHIAGLKYYTLEMEKHAEEIIMQINVVEFDPRKLFFKILLCSVPLILLPLSFKPSEKLMQMCALIVLLILVPLIVFSSNKLLLFWQNAVSVIKHILINSVYRESIEERFVLFFSRLTRHGTSWRQGVVWFIVVMFCVSLIGTISTLVHARIYMNADSSSTFIQIFSRILLKLLYPPALFRETNFAIGNITFWTGFKDFVKVAWSIFYGAMVWQIIRAFRKYSRSLE